MITSFYDSGYIYHDGGFAHGRIHGLIEGRALGRDQGFEMWEEIGFYEGFRIDLEGDPSSLDSSLTLKEDKLS